MLCLMLGMPLVHSQVLIKLPYPKFELPTIPSNLIYDHDRNIWLVQHYWDNFNFNNPQNIKNTQLPVPYISNFLGYLEKVPTEIAYSELTQFLDDSKKNTEVYDFVINTLDNLLGNTVSPYRNDEFYIVVLEDILSSKDNLTDEESSRFTQNLSMARKNRINTIASEFSFIDSYGNMGTLHNIKAEYTLLMFYSPGCHACEIAEEELRNSELINNWIESGDLKLLAFAPESPEDLWKTYQSHLPENWINAYDPGQVVWMKRIYDIQGFPTIYLLDKDKRVLLKDTNVDNVNNYLMMQAMTLPAL